MKKGKFVISWMVILLLASLSLFHAVPTTYGLWWTSPNKSEKVGRLVQIGVWGDVNLDNLNDIVEQIRQSDKFLLKGTNTVHVIGVQTSSNTPTAPASFSSGDVFVWQRASGTIIAAQVVGSVSNSVFDTWANLDAALVTSTENITNAQNSYIAGGVYTRLHAPVTFSGQRWLARHDNVTSTPSVGADWFLISPTGSWINQSYPVGSFVERNGVHYRKIDAADTTPGTDALIWEEVPLHHVQADAPDWYSRAWSINEIVKHNDQFYVSVVNNNAATPGASANWV
ncbi:MAG: hypothetical protein FWD32_01780, partial [Firmicutes bacterium]|nr:hypothetical protein [Bacillota bacterium]